MWTSGATSPLDSAAVTLVEGSAFCISLPSGDMMTSHPHGLFFRDTRFLAELSLKINGEWPEPLAAHLVDPFSATFVVQASPEHGRADSSLVVTRQRFIGRGMREDVVIRNYGAESAFCHLEFEIGCDFADLFEVKEGRVKKVGDLQVEHHESRITHTYTRGAFRRAVHLDFSQPPRIVGSATASYEIIVPPGDDWSVCLQVTPVIDDVEVTPRHQCGHPVERAAPSTRLEAWRHNLPTLTTDHIELARLYDRSAEDLAALRLFDPEHPDRTVVAAGAPWFMTVFGRDSLLTSWMSMLVDPDLALGTLQTLARYQGENVNPLTEEEPGRILHEMRFGESARLSLGGGNVYYGSVDATPLFVMVLGELQRWGTRAEDVDALLPFADRALTWIDEFGDRDGDGYVEYMRTSDRGLRNQGWKDSWDSTTFLDGRLAEPPIALCEVQGYVYAALLARSHFATEHGDDAMARRLRERADDLKVRFNRDFWLDDLGRFAMGLDRDKRPIDTLTSNMGHCLWTGIVDDEKAPLVGKQLLGDDMFSGWGIRTLATGTPRFNPVSYHNGSVWPHDNAICAAGLMRYGLIEEAHRVMEGIVGAAGEFGHRLPELFAGFSRSDYSFPVAYPTSCSPQAWAAASPLLMLRTLLRFEPDVRSKRLNLAPALPDWIGSFRLDGVDLMGGQLMIEAADDRLVAFEGPPGLELLDEPRAS
ncbi:MAG: glycogen debranching N-terminal domain-containing protein [Acidimicrobiia bacterium]